MQLQVLMVESLDKLARDITEELQQHFMRQRDEEDEEQRNIRRIIGQEDDEEEEKAPFSYMIDTAQYYKVVDFTFKKELCSSIYISSMLYKGEKVMVVVVDGMDY